MDELAMKIVAAVTIGTAVVGAAVLLSACGSANSSGPWTQTDVRLDDGTTVRCLRNENNTSAGLDCDWVGYWLQRRGNQSGLRPS